MAISTRGLKFGPMKGLEQGLSDNMRLGSTTFSAQISLQRTVFFPKMTYLDTVSLFYRGSIDLNNYERERSHYIELELEDHAGFIAFYMTITALVLPGSESDLSTHICNRQEVENEFAIKRTWRKPDEIGWLQVCANK